MPNPGDEDPKNLRSLSSEVGSPKPFGVPEDDSQSTDQQQVQIPLLVWRELLDSQRQNLLHIVRNINPLPSSSSQIYLPEFDPDKGDNDAKAWCSTVDMVMGEKSLVGGALVIALSRAFKGSASRWLAQISFPGMRWAQFKELFLAKYVVSETPASTLLGILNGKPLDGESYSAYAGRVLSCLCVGWHNLNVEETAVATTLAHMAQFDSRIQRLVFTGDIKNRDSLLRELKAISFNKRPNVSTSLPFDFKRPRLTPNPNISKCSICGRTNHKADSCFFRKSGQTTNQASARTPLPPLKTGLTCFRCGGVGHVQATCRAPSVATTPRETPVMERRIDFCEANPSGTLMHNGELLPYTFDSGAE
uniref:Gag-Pol polyprotein n=2 Tax=Lygus hesperus TaxID=30085 RepID=A0A0A9WAU2_LYGHE